MAFFLMEGAAGDPTPRGEAPPVAAPAFRTPGVVFQVPALLAQHFADHIPAPLNWELPGQSVATQRQVSPVPAPQALASRYPASPTTHHLAPYFGASQGTAATSPTKGAGSLAGTGRQVCSQFNSAK